MIKDLLTNMTKNQKIAAFVVAQGLFIIILVSIFSIFTKEPEHVFIDESASQDVDLPNDAKKFVSENLWVAIQSYVPGVDSDSIKDVVIRDGTYEEQENEDGSTQASFIVDIDSLKQTYVVNAGWSKNKDIIYEVGISCPPQNQMKYPETICYSAYNNTYSLELYLPHLIYPEGEDSDSNLAPNIYIDGDEYNKTIDIMVSVCDADKFKKQAMDYLNSTPINLKEYTIEYEINDVDVECN